MSSSAADAGGTTAATQSLLPGLIVLAIVAASAFFAPMDIAEGDSTRTVTVGVDLPVLCKLAVSGIAFCVGVLGVILSARTRRVLLSIPGLLLLTLAALFLIASTQAINSAGFPAAMIFLGYVLFLPTALQQNGLYRVIQAIWLGMILFIAFGWVLYLFFPVYGVFSEMLDDALVVTRMGGAAHPNAFGRICLLTILSATYLWRVGRLHRGWFGLSLLLAGLAAYLSLSRTAMAAGFAAMLCLWLDVLWSKRGVALLLVACGLGVIGVTGLVAIGKGGAIKQKLMSLVTKTGEMEEVKSGTGRNEIWQESIRLIKKRPWLGYGLNSGPGCWSILVSTRTTSFSIQRYLRESWLVA